MNEHIIRMKEIKYPSTHIIWLFPFFFAKSENLYFYIPRPLDRQPKFKIGKLMIHIQKSLKAL